ncbi:MAG: CvpA family protein [Rhodospirillaceae bacterium]|nr:CvpA family protein [Rhodospirillaceae bacterium]
MDNIPINGLDLAVIAILLISALLAFMRGFVHEVLSIGAWVGAAFGALYGLPFAQPIARKSIPFDWAADAAAIVVLFLAGLLVLSLITNALSKTVQASALNNLDRSLGFLFGLARAAVILSILLIAADWLMDKDNRPQWMQKAKTLPALEMGADTLKNLMPDSFMAAEDAAKEAAGTAKDAMELKQTLDRLTQPTPGAQPAPEGSAPTQPETGYDNKERRDMERLLQSTEPPKKTEPPQ